MATITKADYEALAHFRHLLRRFLHFTEEGAQAQGISPQQHQALLAIKGQPERDWASVAEVAFALQIRHNTAVELLNRCEAAGLVARSHDEAGDRRQVQVTLTPQGEAILARLSERNLRELQSLRAALNVPALEFPGADAAPDETN